jgi:hypothetical protein
MSMALALAEGSVPRRHHGHAWFLQEVRTREHLPDLS